MGFKPNFRIRFHFSIKPVLEKRLSIQLYSGQWDEEVCGQVYHQHPMLHILILNLINLQILINLLANMLSIKDAQKVSKNAQEFSVSKISFFQFHVKFQFLLNRFLAFSVSLSEPEHTYCQNRLQDWIKTQLLWL